MHALIFIVISVIGTRACIFTQKIYHLILIKRNTAGIRVKIFVIIIKFTALTISYSVFCHVAAPLIFQSVKTVL